MSTRQIGLAERAVLRGGARAPVQEMIPCATPTAIAAVASWYRDSSRSERCSCPPRALRAPRDGCQV
jgi:hypothetical protein